MEGDSCQSILARRMAAEFFDIPIAVTVLDGKVYGAYIGNWEPYELPAYDPMVAGLADAMGLFAHSQPGEIDGKPVVWRMNKR